MALTCNPETLTSASVCLQCIKGERTSEAVKTWLVARFAGNSQTPEQLWKSVVTAGYNKLTLKQALQGIVWLLCTIAGGTCTPEAMNAASVAYQKLPWQAVQASIIYLLATNTGQTVTGESLTRNAVTLGYQDFSIKECRQAQAYLLASKLGGMTPKQLNLNTACFQCMGSIELLALETLGTCQATGGITPTPPGYPLYGTATLTSTSSGNFSVNYLVTFASGVYTYVYQLSSNSISFGQLNLTTASTFIASILPSGNTTIPALATANIPAGSLQTAIATAPTIYNNSAITPTVTEFLLSNPGATGNWAVGFTSATGAVAGITTLQDGASGPWQGTIPVPGTGIFF